MKLKLKLGRFSAKIVTPASPELAMLQVSGRRTQAPGLPGRWPLGQSHRD